MTRPLLVAVAHSLDLLTFLIAVSLFGINGEANATMQLAFLSAGLGGVIALKLAGTSALACIAQMRSWALIPAAGAGILGASVNLAAIAIARS